MNPGIRILPLLTVAFMLAALGPVYSHDATARPFLRTADGGTLPTGNSRGRVRISNGTIVTDKGNLLRGCRISTDAFERLPERSAVSSIKSVGLNTIHLYAESFVRHQPGELHALVDSLVSWTQQDSLYLVLTIGCLDQNGKYDYDFTMGFWNYYAPRYADKTHVVYEIHNEPHAWSPPYPDPVLKMELDAYRIIRAHAPLAHVLLFSYAVPSSAAGILQDIQKLGTEIDWTRCSVATHGYGVTYSELEAVVQAVQNAGTSIVNTEPCYLEIDKSNSVDLFRQQIRVHENHHVSYLHFHDVDEVRIPSHFKSIIETTGIGWEPDFGSWPPPVVWNAFSTMEAEYFSSQGGPSGIVDLGNKIGYISNDDYVLFDSVDFRKGAVEFEVRSASGGIGGVVEIRLDSLNGFLAGQLQIEPTGGWDNWTTKTCSVNGIRGIHKLVLKFTGGVWDLFDIDWFKFTPDPTAVKQITEKIGSPTKCRLEQNFPNPFNAYTTIRFALDKSTQLNLSVYNLQGQELCNLAKGHYQPGEYQIKWPAEQLSSGIYMVSLATDSFRETKKMVIQK